ncbi:MAG: hypothetical protein JWR69_1992 [Pedosphaera sp.]|nr:hypothetical protein [Pedosphaera sp.]
MSTKRALQISAFLNLAVLATLAWVLASGRTIHFSLPAEPASATIPRIAVLADHPLSVLPEAALQAESKPFHWSQLEAADYRVYVANLRAIGCPELTIRDIISADVDGLYSEKRQALRLGEAGIGPWSRQEERQFVASLIGQQIAAGAPMPQTAESAGGSKPLAAPSMPLVFRAVDLDKLHLNDGQREAIAQLQREFVGQIGGSDQNPSDPVYRERWQQAQPEIDEMLRGMIGAPAYLDYQLEAAGVRMVDKNGGATAARMTD